MKREADRVELKDRNWAIARAWSGAVAMLLLFQLVFVVALVIGFALQGWIKLKETFAVVDPYADIADPDVTAWECPHCHHQTYHGYGYECDSCGYNLDRELVVAALTKRNCSQSAASPETLRRN